MMGMLHSWQLWALSLVSSLAGLLFLVIGTGEVVQCMNMHKDMFHNSKNMHMDKFVEISRSMSVCMGVKRLHGEGESCYGHHSLDCHSRFHKLQEGGQPSWLGGRFLCFAWRDFKRTNWQLIQLKCGSHSFQQTTKNEPKLLTNKPNIKSNFQIGNFPNIGFQFKGLYVLHWVNHVKLETQILVKLGSQFLSWDKHSGLQVCLRAQMLEDLSHCNPFQNHIHQSIGNIWRW